jgi:hypothetical protein
LGALAVRMGVAVWHFCVGLYPATVICVGGFWQKTIGMASGVFDLWFPSSRLNSLWRLTTKLSTRLPYWCYCRSILIQTKLKQFVDGAAGDVNGWRSVNAREALNGWNYVPWFLPQSPYCVISGKPMRSLCLCCSYVSASLIMNAEQWISLPSVRVVKGDNSLPKGTR